jgi:lipopolysaccharide transport system ATP-binding protein
MSDTLIKVEGVSKKFCRSLKKSLWYGMQDLGREITGRKHGGEGELRPDEFWAVNDVSFELKRGECLGLIGRNGAGKTTLLRMLNGLIKPDRGRIEMRGRVGALIALGAGFNPILTGRENIYVNASVLGLTKQEIDAKLDEIIDFAEIDEFIDMPVQSYSSGMNVRLGFSVATTLKPDILILDEVLAVGDAPFRAKCYQRISELSENSAVIFVSHNMDHLARISTTSLVLEKGNQLYSGEISGAIKAYESLDKSAMGESTGFLSLAEPLTDLEISISTNRIQTNESLRISFAARATELLSDLRVKVAIYNSAGAFAADGLTVVPLSDQESDEPYSFSLDIPALPLKNGMYALGINLLGEGGKIIAWSFKQHHIEVTGSYHGAIADCQLVITEAKSVHKPEANFLRVAQ